MIKILHSADWHLDSPIQCRTPQQAALLRSALLEVPNKIAAVCRAENCDIMLLSGDLFDGSYTQDSYLAVRNMLEEVKIPVFITPGNHDYTCTESAWTTEAWPENVHIFTQPAIEPVIIEKLSCCIYGAGYTAMECAGLLENFRASSAQKYNIGILHGDPTQISSPYCPVTGTQVQESGLDYLALGHIHKGGHFREGKTLCAWPGCPMGRGYDELGQKGVLVVTLDEQASARFVPLDAPKFFDLEITSPENCALALSSLLPPIGNADFYRITFKGTSLPIDLAALYEQFSRFSNLELRDRTVPPVDIWSAIGNDSFEGMYFTLLKDSLKEADEQTQKQIMLAAEISRRLLDGQEVLLP